jgi:hypothetical protein
MVIAAVALAIAAIRDGHLSWSKMVRMAALNRTLFVAVLIGACVWEFWYRRAKRHHTLRDGRAS